MLKKQKPLILHHSNTYYFKNEIKSISKLFQNFYILNYQDYFNNYGDLLLKKKILNYIYFQNISSLIIFCHNDNFQLSLSFLKKIKHKVKIVFLFKDDQTNMLIHSRYYALFSDAIVTYSSFAHSYYQSMNLNSFLTTDSQSQGKLINKKKIYDVSFVGSFSRNHREKYIEHIKHNSKLKYFFLDTSKDSKKISRKKYNQIISTSKINLNFSSYGTKKYIFFENFDPFINHHFGTKGRIIEVGLLKGFVLTEYFRDYNSFWKKNEIGMFYNKEDMLNKINFYLKNENKRKTVSSNLFKKCKKEKISSHFNSKLFLKIFHSLKKIDYLERNNNNINYKHFKNLEAMFLFLYILKMLKSLNFKSIFFTLNRFLELTFVNLFSGCALLLKYFYYFYFKK
jgi:hypothetical protein